MSVTCCFPFCSEEIAFYNGNLREKQTIHATFKKLVSNEWCSPWGPQPSPLWIDDRAASLLSCTLSLPLFHTCLIHILFFICRWIICTTSSSFASPWDLLTASLPNVRKRRVFQLFTFLVLKGTTPDPTVKNRVENKDKESAITQSCVLKVFVWLWPRFSPADRSHFLSLQLIWLVFPPHLKILETVFCSGRWGSGERPDASAH